MASQQSQPQDTLPDRLKEFIALAETPFTLVDVALHLGIEPKKLTRDLQTRLAISLRKAGAVKVTYRQPSSNAIERRWIGERRGLNEMTQDLPSALAKWRSELAEMRQIERAAVLSGQQRSASFLPADHATRSLQTDSTSPVRRLAHCAARLLDRLSRRLSKS